MVTFNFLVLLSSMLCIGVESACSDELCTQACDLPCLNNGMGGSCDESRVNPLQGGSDTCICDSCPPLSFCDIASSNPVPQCVGPPLSLLDCSSTACPQSTPTKMYFPHLCTVSGQQVCICMCWNAQISLPLLACPMGF